MSPRNPELGESCALTSWKLVQDILVYCYAAYAVDEFVLYAFFSME